MWCQLQQVSHIDHHVCRYTFVQLIESNKCAPVTHANSMHIFQNKQLGAHGTDRIQIFISGIQI